MPTNKKKHTLFTIYFGLVSLVSFIGLIVALIIFAQKLISTNIITDEEYISQNHWEVDRCDEPIYMGNDSRERTETEKEECIQKAKTTLILQRNVDTKETLILSGLRIIVLLAIFPIHFIYFKKYNK
ncbi:MAG TPA: hypothetical protein P5060_02970 [Candidatus Absconditabacterales bacterium]|nr:hypothetical protein [Candidatus Absconditabacterales bacterium]